MEERGVGVGRWFASYVNVGHDTAVSRWRCIHCADEGVWGACLISTTRCCGFACMLVKKILTV